VSSDRDAFDARARSRSAWPVRKHTLGAEPSDDLSAVTTAEERLEMMWQLALDAWASSGWPLPDYRRADAPGRILRSPRDGDADVE
jgi:hypothetical protein